MRCLSSYYTGCGNNQDSLRPMATRGKALGVKETNKLVEILTRPSASRKQEITCKYEMLLVDMPHLEITKLERSVLRQAARLHAEYRLRALKPLLRGACLTKGARACSAHDRLLERLEGQVERVTRDVFSIEDDSNRRLTSMMGK